MRKSIFNYTMTQIEARKLILRALYNDEWLYKQIILKGGNALSMIYGVGMRTSLDLDFSISQDFTNIEEVSNRIEKALIRIFKEQKIMVFDYSFNAKPKESKNDWWGGYRAEFKLVSESLAKDLKYKTENLRRQALPVDIGSQKRIYSIEISKYEYIGDYKIEKYDGMNILVYSPLLLAIEKLRALFQQHPDYKQISANAKRSRSRDLYDIWAICDHFAIDLVAHLEVVKTVFDAKKVSMELLKDLDTVSSLHKTSWADVELSVTGEIEDYDFYFDYVNKSAKELYTKWKINPP